MSARSYLSIGDVLTLLRQEFPDVTISKIRFLESQGLVNPERTPSGYRKFYEHDVERLRWVLRQQREHFLPLKVIKDRLDDGSARPSADATAADAGEPGRRRRRRCPASQPTAEEVAGDPVLVGAAGRSRPQDDHAEAPVAASGRGRRRRGRRARRSVARSTDDQRLPGGADAARRRDRRTPGAVTVGTTAASRPAAASDRARRRPARR